MPVSLSQDQVIVTLACSTPNSITFPQRRILLSPQKDAILIGRASGRSHTFEPKMYNGWIDSPVISRQHAELSLDSQSQTVFVRDAGSRHGTYCNGTQLRHGQPQALHDGDLLEFGVSIEHGHKNFPQCTMKVGLQFGQPNKELLAEKTLSPQPVVFQVPDETDCEDSDDDYAPISTDSGEHDDCDPIAVDCGEHDEAIQSTMAALQKNGLELAEFHGFDTSDAIDLISEPDLVSDNNLHSSSSPLSKASEPAAHDANDCTLDLDDDIEFLHEKAIALGAEKGHDTFRQQEDVCMETKDALEAFLQEKEHPSSLKPTSTFLGAETTNSIEEEAVATQGEKSEVHELCATANNETTTESQAAKVNSHQDENPVELVIQDSTTLKKSEPEKVVPRKRKADLISDVAAHPVQTIKRVEDLTLESRERDNMAANSNEDVVFKRIRMAAEYFGVAALGGAAVMTALIVTAPNL